jgi:hypothetical protein
MVLGIIGLFVSPPSGGCYLVFSGTGLALSILGLASRFRTRAIVGMVLNGFGIFAGLISLVNVIKSMN